MSSSNRPTVSVRIVRADGGPETVIPMQGDSLICGRSGELAIPDDPFVAEQQLRFFFSGPRLAVEDVGGGNGVFTRLRGDRPVPSGSEIRVGRQRLVLEPIPALTPAEDGTVSWGSPDEGYHYRLLQIFEGGVPGAAYPLKEGDNLIGREVGDITFPHDGFVSGRHAVLQVAGDKVVLKDLGSSNGTFLRLAAPAFVDHGEQFLIGRQLVRVELSAPPP